MGKIISGVLLGALCGGLLTAVVLLGPFAGSVANFQNGANSIDSKGRKSQLGLEDHAQVDSREDQRSELQHLLDSLEKGSDSSPAAKARLQRVLSDLVWFDPIATAVQIFNATSRHKQPVLRQFLRLWVDSRGIELVHDLPAAWLETHPQLYREVFQTLVHSNPQAMLPHIMALASSDLRVFLLASVAHKLDAKKMPDLFLSLAQLNDSEIGRLLAWDSMELASKAPRQLLAWSNRLNEPHRRLAAQAALEGLARVDPKAALALVDAQSTRSKRRIIGLALQQLAATEPHLAAAEAESRGKHFAEVAKIWANRDPIAASRWLIERTPEARNSSHDPLMSIASSWSGRDLDAALAFAETLSADLRGGWASAIAAQLAVSDPDRLETLAQTLSDTPYAAKMFARLAFQRYDADPEGTISQVLSLSPAMRDEPLSSLIVHAMDRSPESAAGLLHEIADEEKRMDALRTVLRRWARSEDGAMQRWLASKASPSLRDEAYATLAADQPKLLPWIKDRELRVATYLGITHGSRSTAGVRKLLEQIELSEAQWESLDSAAAEAAK